MFRSEFTSCDGERCAVTVEVSDHRDTPSKAALNDIADRWRIERTEIVAVLNSWTAEQLQGHLETLTAHEAKPPALRHGR